MIKLIKNYFSKETKLLSIYDLDKAAASYGFIEFFQNALLYKKKKNIKEMDLLLISGEHNGFKFSQFLREKNFKLDYANIRLHNIVLSLVMMFKKNFKNFFYLQNRNDFYELKKKYRYTFPDNYKTSISKHEYGKNIRWINVEKNTINFKLKKIEIYNLYKFIVKKKIKTKKKIISITLRESSYNQNRNNNIKNIIIFLEFLIKKNFFPIIIRDFEKVYEDDKLKKYEIFPEANFNLMLRAALYKVSYLNLFSSNGPHLICAVNNINSMAFKYGNLFYPNFDQIVGNGERSKVFGKNVKLFNLDDSIDNLISKFNVFVKK
jgi:hypothetical protein